jgi:hypothetical protein
VQACFSLTVFVVPLHSAHRQPQQKRQQQQGDSEARSCVARNCGSASFRRLVLSGASALLAPVLRFARLCCVVAGFCVAALALSGGVLTSLLAVCASGASPETATRGSVTSVDITVYVRMEGSCGGRTAAAQAKTNQKAGWSRLRDRRRGRRKQGRSWNSRGARGKNRKLQRKSQTRRRGLAAGVGGDRRSLRGMTREWARAEEGHECGWSWAAQRAMRCVAVKPRASKNRTEGRAELLSEPCLVWP